MVSVFEVRLAAQLAKQKSENGTASTGTASNGDYHIENEVPKIGRKETIFQSIVRRHKQRQNGGRGVNRKRRNTSSFRNIVAFQSLVKRVTVQSKKSKSYLLSHCPLLKFSGLFLFFFSVMEVFALGFQNNMPILSLFEIVPGKTVMAQFALISK